MKKQTCDILIYGAGGLGKEVACTINRINTKAPTWNLIGFIDDAIPVGTPISHYGEILGGIEFINGYPCKIAVVIAVGNGNISKKIVSQIYNPNIEFPNLIYPDFWVEDKNSFSIGKGNIIQGSCIATCDVTIGDFNILNGSVVIGHDVKIGNHNIIMPATRISGEVEIGNFNLLGVSSIILQQIKIKNNTKIAAGAVLMTNPKENCTYIGNPAKKFNF
ncbi:acetyltransferase [Methanobrevibacter sp.]|uniref:acetyltransferase n=1 Tax=Methanobrevibacter sp. TaxID=66852 RepID=UPI0038906229